MGLTFIWVKRAALAAEVRSGREPPRFTFSRMKSVTADFQRVPGPKMAETPFSFKSV